jgi:hypothetical protein
MDRLFARLRDLRQPRDYAEELREEQKKLNIIFYGALQFRHNEPIIGDTLNLQDIDPTTHLRRSVLLASGIENLRKGNLVIVSMNRLGVKGHKNAPFARGGVPGPEGTVQFFGFTIKNGDATGTGNFLGIVLNSESKLVKRVTTTVAEDGNEKQSLNMQRPEDIDEFYQVAFECAEAVILAESNYRIWQSGSLQGNILNQAALDSILDSVIAGRMPEEL